MCDLADVFGTSIASKNLQIMAVVVLKEARGVLRNSLTLTQLSCKRNSTPLSVPPAPLAREPGNDMQGPLLFVFHMLCENFA